MSDAPPGEDTLASPLRSWQREAVADTEAVNGDAAPSASAEPVRVGRYLVVERIGAGAMGVVYAAYDPKLERKVAVKLLLPGRGGPDARARLLREAQAMAQLRDPHVVAVHDVGERDDAVYIAMEFVRGETLRTWSGRPRRWQDVLALYTQAGRGLAAAHHAGLVHRDFKPDNVLVDEAGRAMVADFGLARASAGTETERADAARVPGSSAKVAMTEEGAVLGTPAYMAPEQFRGASLDARTDQFAWCVAAWEGLHGERPFAGDNVFELATAVSNGEVREPALARSVPRWLTRVLQRGLAVDPASRWPSMDALLAELARGQARARARIGVFVVGALVLTGAGVETARRIAQAGGIASCERAGAAITSVWPGDDDGASTRVHDAMLATGASHAATTFDKVRPWLDDYARAWQDARTQTCLRHEVEASWDDDLTARADECLDERRAVFAAVVDTLGQADAAVGVRAVAAAVGLPRLEPCEDARMLSRRPDLPRGQLEEVTRIRNALARATALRGAGRGAEGLVEVEAAHADAETLAWMPLLAETRLGLGAALGGVGEYERAEAELVDAYVEAGKSGATQLAEDAANELLLVVGVRRARHAEGLLWGRLAEVEHARLGADEDDLASANRMHYMAMVHAALGDYAEAIALGGRALAIYERVVGAEHPVIAEALVDLANAHNGTGNAAEAKALYGRAVGIFERAFGRHHPDVAIAIASLATLHAQTNSFAQAKALYGRALVILEEASGPEHPDVAVTLTNLASVHDEAGEYAQAEVMHRRALAIFENRLGPEHPHVASSLVNLAVLYADNGEPARAKPLYERSLAIFERSFGPDHPHVATTLSNLGAVHTALGDHTLAIEALRRALAIHEKNLGPEHVDVHQARLELADAIWDSGQHREEALELVDRALEGFRNAGDEQRREQAEAWLARRRP